MWFLIQDHCDSKLMKYQDWSVVLTLRKVLMKGGVARSGILRGPLKG